MAVDINIEENLIHVTNQIKASCTRSARNHDDVQLIAVSKTKPIELLEKAYQYGCREFGENKVQEMCSKMDIMPKDIKWHMIGHLQKNKVKYLIGKVWLIHSVDSLELAKEIDRLSKKQNVITNILLEVNVAGETTKFGLLQDNDIIELVKEISILKNIKLKGLMTIAPYTENPETNRTYFRRLKQLSVDIKNKNIDNICMDELSMGMSGDYEVAIEEGATYVRVGTGIFGERDYSK